jgi:hypothetical protein
MMMDGISALLSYPFSTAKNCRGCSSDGMTVKKISRKGLISRIINDRGAVNNNGQGRAENTLTCNIETRQSCGRVDPCRDKISHD